MHHRVAACCVAAWLTCPAMARAQTMPMPAAPSPAARQVPTASDTFPVFPAASLFDPAWRKPADTGFWLPFKAIPDDFVRFLSPDTLKVLGLGGAGALAAYQWDAEGLGESQEHLRPSLFTAGNIGGGFVVQAGTSFGLYSLAKLSGSHELAAAGADLVRAQVLAQAIVQAGKFATHRPRPDASNHYSLPSGHTASAFATATVLRQHFGWKAGVPAYSFGAYVAVSRMSANKHHLSDVLLGAAIGIAAGRTVTVGAGRAQFEMGVAPTLGGAAITFTKR